MKAFDADKLLDILDVMIVGHKSASDVYDVVDSMPTVDAVEVVRCKDCKHKPTGSGVNHDIEFPEQDYRCPCSCEDDWYSWMPDDDWFCANGERREDETD